MSRLEQAKQDNLRINALTNRFNEPVAFKVDSSGDLVRLRQAWLPRDSIPCLIPSREQGADHSFLGMDVRTLLTGDNSSGRFSAHDIIVAPGAGLQAHYQEAGDVFLLVVDGEIELTVGCLCELSHRASFAFVPARTTTAWLNKSAKPAHIFMLIYPAGADRAFAEAHALWSKSSNQAFTALERYGFHFDLDGPLPNDARTNQAAERLEAEIWSFEDYAVLRQNWSRRVPTPKLVHAHSEAARRSDSLRKLQTEEGGGVTTPQAGDRSSGEAAKGSAEGAYFVTGDETSGVAVCGIGTMGAGYGAEAHYQPSEEEFFYVLEGELKLTCGADTRVLKPGAFGFAPRNATHGFTNTNDGQTRVMTLNSPAGHERGFEMLREEMRKPEHANGPSKALVERLSHHGWQMHDFPMV